MAKLKISNSTSNQNITDHAGNRNDNRLMRVRRHSFSDETSCKKPRNTDKNKNKLDLKSIKKLYMNNKVGPMKNTKLETIFEHKEDENAKRVEESFPNNLLIFSKLKVKRCTKFPDINFKPSKTLKEKRKKRIRKVFGKQKRFKRISMQSFLRHLNTDEITDVPKTEEILII